MQVNPGGATVRRLLALLFIVSCAAHAANSRTICGQTVDETSYTGTFPYWMDGTAVLYAPNLLGSPVFLGELTFSESSSSSILNRSGTYGSSSSSTSLFNSSGTWGSAASSSSVCNLFATYTAVPQIYVSHNSHYVNSNPLRTPGGGRSERV